MWVPSASGGQKRASDALELELQRVGSHHMDDGKLLTLELSLQCPGTVDSKKV